MKILVVDGHVLIREALRGVLKEVKGDAAVLEAAQADRCDHLQRRVPALFRKRRAPATV